MKRVSKVHLGDMGKSFSLAFVLITIIWTLVSYFSFGSIYLSWQILVGNLAVSAVLAVIFYRLRYHRVLEYDSERFILRTGQKITEGGWKDFTLVSLYHKGYEVFAVRLYRKGLDETDFVDLPATDLGLNASDFRFEVAGFV